jgi:DNA-binding PucR family transcriptional regulator
MHRLDHNAEAAFQAVNALFAEVMAAVERRREEVMAEVERKKEEKRRVLEEQLKIIHTEKAQVDKDVEVTVFYTKNQ